MSDQPPADATKQVYAVEYPEMDNIYLQNLRCFLSVETKWFDARETCILITVLDYEATWTSFHAAIDEANALAKTVTHEVIVILNPQGIDMPKEGQPLSHLRQLMVQLPPNVKFLVAIMGNLRDFERSISNILANVMFRKRLKLVNTPEEAYTLIPDS